MKILKYLASLAVIIWSTQNVSGGKIWDIALLDVSSDLDAYAKNGINEMHLADSCLRYFINDELIDSVMFFAGGRAILPVGDISESNRDYSSIRRIIGDGTSIFDALASCMQLSHNIGRIVVITNGREVESSISSATLSKIMKSKGISVDAIVVSAGCDSIYVKSWYSSTDSTLYERNHVNSGLMHIVDRTGGKIITIEGNSDISEKINGLCSVIVKENPNSSKISNNLNDNLNENLTKKVLARIKPQKLYICEVDTNYVIKYCGIKYHGINDILNATISDSYILIDQDVNRNQEDSQPINIIFVSNPNNQDKRRLLLNQVKSDSYYCKLYQNTPIDILPMIYYSGIGDKMQLCGLEFESTED